MTDGPSVAEAVAAYVRASSDDQLFPATEVERELLAEEVDVAVMRLVKRYLRGIETVG